MPVATPSRRPLLMPLMLVWVSACLSGTELVTPPTQPPSTITLVFRPDSADAATAAALGWTNGIPGVAVTLSFLDSTSSVPRMLQGSDSGTLLLDGLSPGGYAATAVRWLTDSERVRLPAGDDAVGFVSHVGLGTGPSPTRVSVSMVASRRHGLVISEVKSGVLEVVGQPDAYFYSDYLRLYNNTDSTIYLDGMLVGEGFAWQFDYPNFPCSLYQPFTLDPLGIWAKFFHQLPGRGRDYPLAPGATTLLVTDAVDHRALYPTGLDLRQANFEFYDDGSDVDNPDVPNAPSVGPQSPWFGHGLWWSELETVVWVARPFDLATMHTEFVPSGNRWARIPADALLDVMAIKTTFTSGYPECPQFVLPTFDRQAVKLLGTPFSDDTLAYKRIQLPFTINGLPVLQHTRTSAWDFTVGPRSPFATP